jgi:hypothetical protein
MRFPKMTPASTLALAGAVILAVTVGTAVSIAKTHHKWKTVAVSRVCGMRYYGGPKGGLWPARCPDPAAAVWEPQRSVFLGPSRCGMRYYGGPKGGLWPAPCPDR